ncbi:MAG: hypothetical protein GEU28_10560 [Dehalococcoidia bacterium]|nr:hypothetical protein [Dehalococcoidia bacterium]
MIVGLSLLSTQGLGRFQERASDAFAEAGTSVGDDVILDIAAETFQEIWIVAGIVLLLASALGLMLRRGKPGTIAWTPMAGMAEDAVDTPATAQDSKPPSPPP